jgi:hypothetical protein
LVEQTQIEEAFAQHYEELFSTPPGCEFSIDFDSIGHPTPQPGTPGRLIL